MSTEPLLAFLDIETTGLNPFRHDVLEVAYLLNEDDNTKEASFGTTYFSLPIDSVVADEKALSINRYHDRRAELQAIEIPYPEAAAQLAAELDGYMIVGANPTFDLAFLCTLLDEFGREPTWHYRCLDLNTLAAGWMGARLPVSTQEIAEEFDVPLSAQQHTALADATWNREAYFAIIHDTPTAL